MPTYPQPYSLITGATSGIGRSLAYEMARANQSLFLVGRHLSTLEEVGQNLSQLSNAPVIWCVCDLEDANCCATLESFALAKQIQISVIIHAAGWTRLTQWMNLDKSTESRMMQVLIHTPLEINRWILPQMKERKAGKIMHIASTAAFQPGPFLSIYYAAKAFIYSYSEALRYELRESGITVTTLCPGPTKTRFNTKAGIRETRWILWFSMTSESVAKAGFTGLMKGKAIIIPGISNQIAALAIRFIPKKWATQISGDINHSSL